MFFFYSESRKKQEIQICKCDQISLSIVFSIHKKAQNKKNISKI